MRLTIATATLINAVVTAQPGSAPLERRVDPIVPHPLEYIESSTGLDTPRWDGGRTEIIFADLNQDGHPDLVSVGDHGSPYINTDMHGISVWFGDGTGRWQSYQNGNFGYGGVAVGDVNNDGLLDVGYGVHHNYSGSDFGDQLIEVALGDGTGRSWTPWDDGLAQEGQDWGMFGTEFADVDGNGLLDVCSVSFGADDGFHLYRNNGDGTWTRTFGFLGGNSNMDLVTGDVNNDGWPDFAAAHQNGTVWLSDGAGGLYLSDTGLPSNGGRPRRGVHLGDITRDGFDDLSFINSSGGIKVFAQAPNSARWVDVSRGLPSSGDWEVTRLVDMNMDGHTDLVAFGAGRAVVLLGDSDANWTLETTFTVPNPGEYAGFAVGDADHNGYPDIAIVSDQGGYFNSRNKLQFFKEASTPRRLSIDIVGPPIYRTLLEGGVFFIDWVSAVPNGEESTVKLELSFNSPNGPWEMVADELPNNGRYQAIFDFGGRYGEVYLRATVSTANGTASDVNGPMHLIP